MLQVYKYGNRLMCSVVVLCVNVKQDLVQTCLWGDVLMSGCMFNVMQAENKENILKL